MGLDVLSLETDPSYIKFIREFGLKAAIRHWDNITVPDHRHYDLALVDGILPRTAQLTYSLSHADYVAVDDFIGGNVKRFGPYLDPHIRVDSKTTPIAIFKIIQNLK